MSKRLVWLLVFASVFVFRGTVSASESDVTPDWGLWPKSQYMVEYLVKMPGGTPVVMREYVGEQKKRVEAVIADKEYVTIMLFEENGVINRVLLNEQKKYLETHSTYEDYYVEFGESLLFPNLPGEVHATGTPSPERIGSDELLGRQLEQWQVIGSDEEGVPFETIVWLDRPLRLVVQMQVDGELLQILQKIELGQQPEILFGIPEGYKPLEKR